MCDRDFTRVIYPAPYPLIVVASGLFSTEAFGINFNRVKQITSTVTRAIARAPSKVMDGGQFATQMVVGGTGRLLNPIKPLQTVVNAGGNAISNVLGTTSRLLGKDVADPNHIMILYDRPLVYDDWSPFYREEVKTVLGYVLSNVILYPDDMVHPGNIRLDQLPVLREVVQKLRDAGADQHDVYDLVVLLSRNGQIDLPEQLRKKVLKVFLNRIGMFNQSGAIEEIRFIAKYPKGYYQLNNDERTDYKLQTNNKYSRCTRIYPPNNGYF